MIFFPSELSGDRRLKWDWEMHCDGVLQARSIHHFGGTGWGQHKPRSTSHFLVSCPSHNCLSLKPTCLMSNTVKRFSKGEFAPCQVKNVLRWRAKLFPCVWAFRFWRYKVYFNWWTSSLRLNCFKQRKRWRNLPSMTSRYGFIICFNGLSSSVLKHLLWLDLICVHGA